MQRFAQPTEIRDSFNIQVCCTFTLLLFMFILFGLYNSPAAAKEVELGVNNYLYSVNNNNASIQKSSSEKHCLKQEPAVCCAWHRIFCKFLGSMSLQNQSPFGLRSKVFQVRSFKVLFPPDLQVEGFKFYICCSNVKTRLGQLGQCA